MGTTIDFNGVGPLPAYNKVKMDKFLLVLMIGKAAPRYRFLIIAPYKVTELWSANKICKLELIQLSKYI